MIHARGFAEDESVFDGVLQQIVRRTIGRWVNAEFRRRPMIIPVVVEV